MFSKKKNEIILTVTGMSCAHCSARVEKALNELGNLTAKADFKKGVAIVKSDAALDPAVLCEAVEKAGYKAELK